MNWDAGALLLDTDGVVSAAGFCDQWVRKYRITFWNLSRRSCNLLDPVTRRAETARATALDGRENRRREDSRLYNSFLGTASRHSQPMQACWISSELAHLRHFFL